METLIVYFSWSGNTEKLVKDVNKQFEYDVFKLERKKPYSSDYNTCAYVEAKEEWQKQHRPIVKMPEYNMLAYDRILLFFPIWWYTFPMPIATLIENLRGYKGEIILFENSYTNDPQYVKNVMDNFKNIDSKINVSQGLFNEPASEHIEFIKKLN